MTSLGAKGRAPSRLQARAGLLEDLIERGLVEIAAISPARWLGAIAARQWAQAPPSLT